MVMRGQYLERPTIIPSGEVHLEGLFHRGAREPVVLIIAPLAAGGSPMETPVVAEMAWAMHRARHATLRFNQQGYGASQGAPDPGSNLSSSQAALTWLRESGGTVDRAAVLGIASGAPLALHLAIADGGLTALVLLAPPVALFAALESTPHPPTLVALPEGHPWPGSRGRRGRLLVEELPGTDAQFLRGLPAFGQAVTVFLDSL